MNNSTLDNYVNELLHIDDVDKNKLININGGNKSKTFKISNAGITATANHVIEIILNRIGKPGNTVMRFSAENQSDEQVLGQNVNCVDWENGEGVRDANALKKFIDGVYKELSLKGNNPLFLSVGAIDYKVSKKGGESLQVKSPLLIFPIKLIRSENNNTPVYIEFINDDIYVNPCLVAKLQRVYGDKLVEDLPHPNGAGHSFDEEISLDALKNYNAYFLEVEKYVENQKSNGISENTVFTFDKNAVYIAEYNHDEICVYYDIKRNRDKINASKLVKRIFSRNEGVENATSTAKQINTVLPTDSVQERIIRRVVNGESLIIKGPPGTGKTLTITNMIASLLAENKKIILSSTKLAAMNEVYAKLPKELRKFAMLLDSETESQTVKINPVDVRKDLLSLLNDRKTYKADALASGKLNLAIKEKSTAVRNLNAYVKSAHVEKDVLGVSYYDALNEVFNCESEPIAFTDSVYAYALNLTDFNDLTSKVEKASNYFKKVCDGNLYYKNPFVPLSEVEGVNFEKALAINESVNGYIEKVKDNLADIYSTEENLNAIKLLTLYAISAFESNEEEISNVLSSENAENLVKIEKALKDYLITDDGDKRLLVTAEITEEIVNALKCSAFIDGSLTVNEFNSIIKNERAHAIAKDDGKVKSLINHVLEIGKVKAEIKTKQEEFYSVFIKDLSDENIKALDLAYPIFAKYNENAIKPKLFDFKGKKYYNLLKTLGYGDEIPFESVVKSLSVYGEIAKLNEEITNKQTRISALFNVKFNISEIETVFLIVEKAIKLGVKVTDYLKNLLKVKADVDTLISNVVNGGDYTLKNVFTAYAKLVKLNELKNAVEKLASVEKGEVVNFALKAVAYKNVVSVGVQNVYEFTKTAFEKGKNLKENVENIYKLLKKFKEKLYETYYTNSLQVTLSDLEIFKNKSCDRNSLSAVTEYLTLVKGKNILPINAFFNKFETGERTDDDIVKTFKKSVYYLAIKEKLKKVEFSRNGLGEKLTRNLEAFKTAEQDICSATVKIIENQCFSRIDADHKGYSFLNAERGGETLRKLFKTHAHEILKLKKCFILSPPTASVLMKNDEFATFDTVIIDEASQLEPKDILPVLFRAKQVILVGDEWQMPPIKHFKTKSEIVSVTDDGEYEILNPDTSVLSLALNNCAFPVEQLVCHYRSNTESLIAFSQKHFYDYMRTFPASEPKTDGVGFKDVYVENAVVKGGVNTVEAGKVVEELNLHFDRYFNEEKGVLTKSVGVVAFGKEQLDYVKGLVDKDSKLSAKIKTALANFGDLPEKLVFFKTIETVQGQETESLILTLTYGRDAEGKIVQRFGELNRGADESKLGQCIFNVAVTRAKSSVTLIHSVKAKDIENENVKYLRDYIELVEKFATDGKAQFVGYSVDEVSGFARSVADTIVALGVEKERVVLDCGVTDGSVKIPLVVLSKDYKTAELGLWLEKPISADKNYLDYNSRYVESLKQRGWNIERVYAHDWFDNNKYEKENIKNVISKYVNV